jgi:hypothetical protein
MKIPKQYPFANDSGAGAGRNQVPASAEETLRLIARLAAPEGLEERIETGLRAAAGAASSRALILRWPVALRRESAWMRGAAAAAIVFVVVGGGWGICSRIAPLQPPSFIALPHIAPPGGFSSAGAMRTPQTLHGPLVAHPATGASQAGKPAAKPQQTPPRHNHSAAARKTIARSSALPRK